MYYTEFITTMAMFSISLVSFIWIIKQIILLANWALERECARDDEEYQKKLKQLKLESPNNKNAGQS